MQLQIKKIIKKVLLLILYQIKIFLQKNYPIQSNNLKNNVNRYPNANQATDKYFNKSVYEKQVQKDTNAGSNLPTTQHKSLTGETIDNK